MVHNSLSQVQADVIRCVLHRASLSVDEISKVVPHKPHVIRRCLEQLREQNLIRKSILCNFYKLGYISFNIHVSVRANKSESVPALIEYLTKHEGVSWCGQTTGEFDYEVSLLSRNMIGVTQLLDGIADTFGDIIEKKQLVAEISHNYFGYKYLSPLPIPVPVVSLQESSVHYPIDRLDATLMRVLSAYGDVPLMEVARKLKEPAAKLSYRKQRLMERGLLLQDIYFLNRCAVVPVMLSAFMTVSNHDAEFRQRFMSFCAEDPNCWCCHRCVGAWDYRVAFYGDSPAAVTIALNRLKQEFGDKVLSITTTSLLQEFKHDYFPFDVNTIASQEKICDSKVA